MILTDAVERIKFNHGPHFAPGLDFGHTCSSTRLQLQLTVVFQTLDQKIGNKIHLTEVKMMSLMLEIKSIF